MAKFIEVLEKLYHVKSLFTVIDIHSSFRSWPFQAVGDTILGTLKDALNQYVTNGLFPQMIDAYRTYTRIFVEYPKYLTINIVQRMDLQANNCVSTKYRKNNQTNKTTTTIVRIIIIKKEKREKDPRLKKFHVAINRNRFYAESIRCLNIVFWVYLKALRKHCFAQYIYIYICIDAETCGPQRQHKAQWFVA